MTIKQPDISITLDQVVGAKSHQLDQYLSITDLYRLALEEEGIGLMTYSGSKWQPLNRYMEALIECHGYGLFAPKETERWRVQSQTGNESPRFFNLSQRFLSKDSCLIIVSDVTEHAEKVHSIEQLLEEERHNATHDFLTGLANRSYLIEYGKQILLEAHRNLERIAVFVLDLDHFKWINDQLGHDTGDQALQWVSKRLQELCRESDFIARLGGDEFCIIQRNVKVLSDVTGLAEKLVKGLCDEMTSPGGTIPTSASIGVAVYPGDGADLNTLLHLADKALYDAKESGRNCFRLYSKEQNIQIMREAVLKTSLYSAFDKNEFQVNYQPIYGVVDPTIIGFEAFLRWLPSKRPVPEILKPYLEDIKGVRADIFFHIMEKMGYGRNLFKWMVDKVCNDLAAWRMTPGHAELTLSINCSLNQIEKIDVFSLLDEALTSLGLPEDSIVLEMREDVFASQDEQVQKKLQLLRSSNIKVLLDGFISSETNLLQLRKWKPDCIKLDMTGLTRVHDTQDDHYLVTDLVTIIKQLTGVPLHAGRVESAEQFSLLRESGCEVAQGYFFSESMDGASVEDLLMK